MKQSSISFLSFLYILFHLVHGVYNLDVETPKNFASLFFRSRMSSKDPSVTVSCFTDYISKSNDVSEAYSSGYNQCLKDAKNLRQGIENDMVRDRTLIAQTSVNVCQRLGACNNLTATLDVFNCHADIGAINTKSVYNISGTASELGSVMLEKYRLIDLKHEQCCKSAERKYVEETAVVYRALKSCLDGQLTTPPISEPEPTTTTPVSTNTSSTTTTTTTTTPTPTTTVPLTTTNSINLDTSTPAPSKLSAKELAGQILDIFK